VWEHTYTSIAQYNLNKKLNEYAKDGWQLVSVIYHDYRDGYELFFKRPCAGQTYSIWARGELLDEGFDDLQKEPKCQT